jgi:amino acid transporter
MEGSKAVVESDLKRDVGIWGLFWASEGSIIGSGWLFAGLYATTLAGPSALISWGIATVIIIILALVHAELGGMFAVTGGTSRYPHYAYGSFAGASFGWFAYIQAASVAPIEVLATIQYFSSVSWAGSWYKPPVAPAINGTLSGAGIAVAVCLMIVFTIVNLVGVRWLANSNNGITTWKVIVPIIAVIVFCAFHFHGHNFSAGGGFFVKGSDGGAHAILDAIPGAGIVFSLLGFEQAVQLGGEARNPQRDLPRAVISAILVGAAIYILAQLAFIAALSPSVLVHYHSWTGLVNDAGLEKAPFYTVAKLAGITWLAYVFRVDAVISPAGTGLIYLTSASRISFGLSKNGYIPDAFEKTNRFKIPAFAVIISALIGLLFLLPFPSWSSLVDIVTGASVLMYAAAPLSLGALRKAKPDLAKLYTLPYGTVVIPLAFVCANLVVYWAGWNTYSTLMLVLIIGYIIMAVSRMTHSNKNQPKIDWGAAPWILTYFVGLGFISFFGSFGTSAIIGGVGPFSGVWVGGDGRLPLWWDILVVAVFSLVIYFWAVSSRLPEEEIDQYIGTVVVISDPELMH